MTSQKNEIRLKPNEIVLFAKIESHDNVNYKNRLSAFYKKNNLSRRFKLIFFEDGKKTVILSSAPNLKIIKRITRILKLISHYKKHHLELLTTSCPLIIDDIWRLMRNA